MNFVEAVKTCFSKYFDFTGRARRSEYWWFYLFTMIGGIVTAILDLILFGVDAGGGAGVIGALFSLAVLVPTISAAARRLHDTNRSGWWQLLPFFGAVVLGFGAMSAIKGGGGSTVLIAAGFILTVVTVILLIVWLATNGDGGDNRFGPDPKNNTGFIPPQAPNRPTGNKRLFD